MDSIVYAALEEVCSQGSSGLALPTLWHKLNSSLSSNGLHPCSDVKKAIWSNLLNLPGLQFEAQGVSFDPQNPKIQSFEESERLNLKIVAAEHLRNSFVGIYDIKASDAGISQPQRRALERLAIARTNGITQNELAKEFGMKGNNIFYVLRNLECRGLIVRQSTIVRTKEAGNEKEAKNSSIVNTNMLHLHRYAKHLGCQQRLEITKEDKPLVANENEIVNVVTDDGTADKHVKEDVHVKDYLPALKMICDKLEQADGKVLVVADIKRDLGYRGTYGHRAWRNICNRLKDAGVVEEFCAKVKEKEVSCLRLLKSFSPKHFEPKTPGHRDVDLDMEQLGKSGKRGQMTDQLVELPIEHQIYDMVDAEGSKGLTITEVCKRLGINNKRYYTRLLNMFSRFGMHLQAESHNRGVAYRVWTSGNYNPEASSSAVGKPESVLSDNGSTNPPAGNVPSQDNSAQITPELDLWASKVDIKDSRESRETVAEPELPHVSPVEEPRMMSTGTVSNVSPPDMSNLALSTPPRKRSYQKYPCLTLTADSARREQWILQRLQEEKFILRAELRRELESLEKGRQTMMDRRTLERSLNKLQQEGYCKCITVSVPVVTNCARSRTAEVVLQPSIHVSPELLGQIYERLRSFDMEIRAQVSSRLKKGQSVPVLDGVQRLLKSGQSDAQAEKSESMRANGFVLAKMVRTKLLHIHLWGYLSSKLGWDDALSCGKHGFDLKNPHSTFELFALDAAIKAMPLELFLQVVGSTEKFEDLVERCKSGLRLSDLPEQEYRRLMDTRATGRLSWIIDILRRLKLIRLVRDGHSEDIPNIPHSTLTYAMELKPYIEEPVSIIMPSSGVISFDLRPQMRHDFILSSRQAVDEYWDTLEYSYAAADSRAALHAFPGSAVHEVFLSRSWTSVRVMTAEQRAELLRRVISDDPNKKLSFKDCEKIAKDLNLTLEQVVRVYYDNRQRRLTRYQGLVNGQGECKPLKKRRVSSSRKRKKISEGRSTSHIEVNGTDAHSSRQRLAQFSDIDCHLTSSCEHDVQLQTCEDEDLAEGKEEAGPNGETEHHSFMHECALSRMKPIRRRKFLWTEKAERQLVIEYVRHRAALGAKFHRTDWSSLPDLPAPADACKRRMALLNSDLKFRKTLMRLCNMLSERYVKHLDQLPYKSVNKGGSSMIVRDSLFGKDCHKNLPDSVLQNEEFGFEEAWDDFDNKNIKTALDEVFRYKRMAKLGNSKRAGSSADEWSDSNMDAEGHEMVETERVSSFAPSEELYNHGSRANIVPQKSRCHRLPKKYSKLLNEGINVTRRAHDSLAVSNAAELFKIVFLSTSTSPEVPSLLAETLRRYSEHDLFAAFNYLREKKVMIGGHGGNPFALSQRFLQSICSSPFPINTGKRAAKFACWLRENEKALTEEGIDLGAELQCGDIFHLCALVFSGELLLSPCLPIEGVGEVEDSRTMKHKSDSNEVGNGNKPKKLKSSLAGEGELISRREKGFPGIRLSICHLTIRRIDAIEQFKDGSISNGSPMLAENDQVNTISSINSVGTAIHSEHVKEILDDGISTSTAVAASETEWEVMASYAEHLMYLQTNQQQSSLLNPELFRDVYLAIQKAGDQGLSMEGISQVLNVQGENFLHLIVEVLEAFGRASKVNGYDCVHVVDSLYRSKYFLTSVATLNQDLEVVGPENSRSDDLNLNYQSKIHEHNVTSIPKVSSTNADEVHKVTILNLPEEVSQPCADVPGDKVVEGCKRRKLTILGTDDDGLNLEFRAGSLDSFRPILPWVNGDGTINKIVYKGLIRRVLGIVMQNPGILEDDIINRMKTLNPQSCRSLLKLMILDNHIIMRKMLETTSRRTPSLLDNLLGSSLENSKLSWREHFFANPMCTTLL